MQLGHPREAESSLLSLATSEIASNELCLDAISAALEDSTLNGAIASATSLLLQRTRSDCCLAVQLVEVFLEKSSDVSREHEAQAIGVLQNEAVMTEILQVRSALRQMK